MYFNLRKVRNRFDRKSDLPTMSDDLSTVIAIFQSTLSRYHKHLPESLKPLDELRLKTIPTVIRSEERKPHGWLEKNELETLVEWKLKHGTFRPNLMKLAASNDAETVRNATRDAFAILSEIKGGGTEDSGSTIERAMKTVTNLKGVGPATASLILSEWDPDKIPFFSDELFRAVHWDGQGEGVKSAPKGKEWARKIGYTMKEYKSLIQRTNALLERFQQEEDKLPAVDLEMIAYVLGKEESQLDIIIEFFNGAAPEKGAKSAKRKFDQREEDHVPKRAKTSKSAKTSQGAECG